MNYSKDFKVGGKTMSFSMGKMANQADGNALIRYGDTIVLVTAVAKKEPLEGVTFLPLTVDYRENTYAAGKIPGGFLKEKAAPMKRRH